jgi:hypothetical protein
VRVRARARVRVRVSVRARGRVRVRVSVRARVRVRVRGVVEGAPAAKQHVRHDAEAPHVARRGVALQPALAAAGEHLGRHVGERACR